MRLFSRLQVSVSMKVVGNMKAVISMADLLHSDVKPDLLGFFFDEAHAQWSAKRWLMKHFSIIVSPNSEWLASKRKLEPLISMGK